MPELPSAVRQRYASLGLSQYDALVLSDEPAVARYFDALLAAGAPAKPAANWVQGDVMAHCKEAKLAWEALPGVMAPAALAEMIQLIEDGTISGKIGKEVLPALLAGEGGAGGGSVRALVEARGLVQISDPAALAAIVDAVLADNPKQLEQYRGGGGDALAALPSRACLSVGSKQTSWTAPRLAALRLEAQQGLCQTCVVPPNRHVCWPMPAPTLHASRRLAAAPAHPRPARVQARLSCRASLWAR